MRLLKGTKVVGFKTIQPNSTDLMKEHPEGYYFHTAKEKMVNEYQIIYN